MRNVPLEASNEWVYNTVMSEAESVWQFIVYLKRLPVNDLNSKISNNVCVL